MSRPLHVLREVLDHEVVDVAGISCGMVDDLEIAWTPQGPAIAALLLGPGAWSRRLPRWLRGLARRIFGDAIVRIPWREVAQVSETVGLRSRADAWGAGALDRSLSKWIARLPMS